MLVVNSALCCALQAPVQIRCSHHHVYRDTNNQVCLCACKHHIGNMIETRRRLITLHMTCLSHNAMSLKPLLNRWYCFFTHFCVDFTCSHYKRKCRCHVGLPVVPHKMDSSGIQSLKDLFRTELIRKLLTAHTLQ